MLGNQKLLIAFKFSGRSAGSLSKNFWYLPSEVTYDGEGACFGMMAYGTALQSNGWE